MNILFITEIEPCSFYGGTSRITYSLARILEEKGHSCFLAYSRAVESSWRGIASGKARFTLDDAESVFKRIFKENRIDIVINNLVSQGFKNKVLPVVYGITRETGAAVISCLHAMPGEEMKGNSIKNSLYRIGHGYRLKQILKDLFMGLVPEKALRLLFGFHFKNKYRFLYEYSDKVVLLSDRFREDFMKLGRLKDDSKLYSIHNMLSFKDFLPVEEIAAKEREVLVLARMDEKSKRISRILRIWRMVCKDGLHEDWKLTIVGGGRDLPYFKKIASRYHLDNISFEGWVEDEIPFFRRASLFMMTSAFEGWGLTLTESQQMGVVPIVFDSYASLRDIIDDGKNGIIVPDKDFDCFYRNLTMLMDDDETRRKMAKEAIETSHRFSIENIFNEWMTLFDTFVR